MPKNFQSRDLKIPHNVFTKKNDWVALLEADPPNATPPLGKINLFEIHHFTSP